MLSFPISKTQNLYQSIYLNKRQSNSRIPCSIIDREESSHPTFIRAFSTKDRGWSWIDFVSAAGGGLCARLMSVKLSLMFSRWGLKCSKKIKNYSYHLTNSILHLRKVCYPDKSINNHLWGVRLWLEWPFDFPLRFPGVLWDIPLFPLVYGE